MPASSSYYYYSYPAGMMAVMMVVKLEDTAGFHQSDNNYLDRRMDTDADASTSTAVVGAAADDDIENEKDDADALMTTNAVAVVVQILEREDSRRNNVLDDTPTTTVEEKEKETRILLRSVEDAVDYDSMQFVYCWHGCRCNYCIARRTNHRSRILLQVQPLLRFLRADEKQKTIVVPRHQQ